jgi:hypothetical protein
MQLRRGPIHQNILAWMNCVQTDIDDLTSWDRRHNGTYVAHVHLNTRACQLARIGPGHLVYRDHTFALKSPSDFIKEEFRPALNLMIAQERRRVEELVKAGAAYPSTHESEQQNTGKKRKHEEDSLEQTAKAWREYIRSNLDALHDELDGLREFVETKMGTIDGEIRKRSIDLLQKFIDMIATNS